MVQRKQVVDCKRVKEKHRCSRILFSALGRMLSGNRHGQENLMGLRSYPDAVQDRVRSNPQLGKDVPKAKSTAAVLLSNRLFFTTLFSVVGLALKSVLNLNNYLSAFWYFLAFGEGLRLFAAIAALTALVVTML